MLRVRLEYVHPWTNHAGFFLARKKNLYRQRGLDVEFVSGDFDRGTPADLLERGEYDIALARLNQLLYLQQGASRLISVAVMNQCQIGGIITTKSSGITRFRDLEGKRVMIAMGVPRLYSELKEAVEADGGDFSKIIFLDPGNWEPDMRTIERGKCDAFINVLWWEPYQGTIPFDQIVTLSFDSVGVAPHHSYYVCVRRDYLDRNPELVRAFLDATVEGYALARKRPEEAIAALQSPLCHIDPDVLHASLTNLQHSWFDQNGNWGTTNVEMVRSYTKWMAKYDHLSVPLEDALTAIDNGCLTNGLLTHTGEPAPSSLSLEQIA